MKKLCASALISAAVGASVLVGAGGAQAALIDATVYSGNTATVTFQNDLGTAVYVVLGYNEAGEAGLLVTETPWAAGDTRTMTFSCNEDGRWVYPTADGQSAPVTSFEILEDNDGELIFNPAVVLDPSRCSEVTPGEENPGGETPGGETPGTGTPDPGTPTDVAPGQQTPVLNDTASTAPAAAASAPSDNQLAETGPNELTPLWSALGTALVAVGTLLATSDRYRRQPR